MSINSPLLNFLSLLCTTFPCFIQDSIVISISLKPFLFFSSVNIVWICLLSIQTKAFDSYLTLNGRYWSHLFPPHHRFVFTKCAPLYPSTHWLPVASEIVSDSPPIAYSGFRHAIMDLSFHPTLSLLSFDILCAMQLHPPLVPPSHCHCTHKS